MPVVAVATFALWPLARPYGDPRWKHACLAALTSAALALLVNQVIAHAWARERPFSAHPDATHLFAPPTLDPSFPSDHASAAFAIAVALLFFSRRVGAVFLAAAVVISVSRVALGLHYPSDVLAGALVGTLAATFVVHAGRPWLVRTAALIGRLTDPVLARVRQLAARR